MKNKILSWIFKNNEEFFQKNVIHPPIDLEKIYAENKHIFELLLIKDFTGKIPKDVTEPALKIFEEHGESFERWILWNSYYINKKAVNDPLKISLYSGMMIYLKVLHVMSMTNKKTYTPKLQSISKEEVETPWIDKVLTDINDFKKDAKNKTVQDKQYENDKEE